LQVPAAGEISLAQNRNCGPWTRFVSPKIEEDSERKAGTAMTKNSDGKEEISKRLNKAIDELRKDVTRVEIWATALGSFSRPVPDYQPDEKHRLGKHLQRSKK
jgi:hypothetical protein